MKHRANENSDKKRRIQALPRLAFVTYGIYLYLLLFVAVIFVTFRLPLQMVGSAAMSSEL